MKRLSLAVGLILFAGTSAYGESINHAHQYEACMQLVKRQPQEAFDGALAWKGLGGGEAAEHCIGTALIAMKNYKLGALRLEDLAQQAKRTKEFKAQILAQAAQGWFLQGDLKRARAVISTAIDLDNTVADFYVDRAQMRAESEAFQHALDDLDTALVIDDAHVDGLAFRANAHRRLENFEAAWADVSKALALDPGHTAALLERGMLYRIEGKNEFARKDWTTLLAIDPSGNLAETARLNLEKMDLTHETDPSYQ